MPPEPLPWERKELFIKERKQHEGVARWRDRENSRWPSPADFRRPPGGGGHGKQGGWHVFNEEPSHGYGVSRPNSKIMEDENVRMSSRVDGRYGRNGRDNRGGGSYYGHREWKVGHPWEMSSGSPSSSFSMGRPNNVFPSVSAGRASHGSPGFSAGRMNIGSPNMSAAMLSNSSSGVSHGRPSNITASVSTGRPSNVSPSVSAGRPRNVSPSVSAGRPSNVSPIVSVGKPSNASPSISTGKPSNVSPSVSAGRSSIVSPSVSTGKPCNASPTVMVGRPSNVLPCISSVMSVDVNIDQRLVDDVLTPSSHPSCSEFGKGSDQVHPENQLDKISAAGGLGAGQKCEKESLSGLDRKLRTWTRSGSLSSRGSGFSHSSSSKSMAVDSIEGSAELQQKILSPLQSPSGEFNAFQAFSAPSEDMSSRKKPRLGWGEGLAKYEKKKTDGPDDLLLDKNGIVSPRAAGFSDCGSPATPSSIACSSSPVVEDKSYIKAENTENDVGNRSVSPNSGCEDFLDGFSINLEKLDLSAVTNMVSSLVGCVYSDDQATVDNFGRSTAMSKLLLLKADILKTVEVTESEVDSLENELKSLKCERNILRPAGSSSLYAEGNSEQGVMVNVIPRPAPLLLESSTTIDADIRPFSCANSDNGEAELKNEDVDSPGTATSRLAELCPPDMVPLVCEMGDGFSAKFNANRISEDETVSRACLSNGEQMHGSTPRGDNCAVCDPADANLLVKEENSSRDSILASNWEAASEASEIFNKLLPANNKICSAGDRDSSNFQNSSSIREKFGRRKQFLRFKERAVTLKFRALKHIWKEDIRLLSNGRSRTKPHKRLELQSRISLSTLQKNRSSIRTRFSPAGQLNLIPTSGIINYIGKLLSDSQMKPYRTALKMPALILDDQEKAVSRFVSTNGLVEDPCALEKERTLINPWTAEEKETFIDKLALFGKDFQKISSFLDYKTTADCVEFYYKNHKSDCFEKTKKADFKKQGKLLSTNTYLVTSGKKWNWEMNAASLDMLGAASVMAACVDDSARKRPSNSGRFLAHKTPQGGGTSAERLKNAGNERERESVAADVLAGICGSLSSEAMSSCITSSVDNGESYQEGKCKAVGISHKQPLMIEVTQNADDETCSDESCGEMDPADWTDMEKSLFIQAVASYGKDFQMISRCVKTRSRDQCKVFFSKARKCLGLDLIHAGNCVGMAPSDDATGGGSDSDNACTMETGSVDCDMDFRQDKKISLSISKFRNEESYLNDIKTEQSRLEDGTVEMDHSVEEAVDGIENSVAGNFCAAEDKPVSDDRSVMNGSDCEHEPGYAVVSSGGGVDSCSQQQSARVDIKAEVLMEEFAAEMPGEPVLSRHETQNNNYDVAKARSGSVCSTQNPSSCQDATQVVCSSSCAGSSVISETEHDKSNDTFHAKKPPMLLVRSPVGYKVAKDIMLSQDEKPTMKDASVSTVDSCGADSQHHQGHPLVNHVESFPPLVSCSLKMEKKEMNGDVYCIKPNAPSLSNSNGSLEPKQCMAQDSYLRKCNGSKSHCPVAERPFLVQSLEQESHHHPGIHSRSSLDPERVSGHGDVKLFGQILSHPSSQQKPNSIALGNGLDNAVLSYPRSENKQNLNLSGHQSIECSSAASKSDRKNHHLGHENIPVRSYGFWDGSRIQTGFSSLPDSAVLLAKYPAAFTSFGTSSSKAEHQPFQSLKVSGNDQNPLSGVSVFPAGEVIHGGRGLPLAMDIQQKQHQDIFSELQRRNGYEAAVSPSLQQGRVLAGMNVVGVGGVLVGSPCPAISDPVAAIKMHYAKADQFGGGQVGSIVREDESWRSNVDIGSR